MPLPSYPDSAHSTYEYLWAISKANSANAKPYQSTWIAHSVTDQTAKDIYNIMDPDLLKDNGKMAKTIIRLIEDWAAEITTNLKNDFTEENEIKVMGVKKEDLIYRMELCGFDKVFDGHIHDVYLDTIFDPENMLDKHDITVRPRFKLSRPDDNQDQFFQELMTLKRKMTKQEKKKYMAEGDKKWVIVWANGESITSAKNFETEIRIINAEFAYRLLESTRLFPFREKEKDRVGYETPKNKAKFDIDHFVPNIPDVKQSDIDEVFEIEADCPALDVATYIKMFWVDHLPTSDKWSRWAYEKVGAGYKYCHEGKQYNVWVWNGQPILMLN